MIAELLPRTSLLGLVRGRKGREQEERGGGGAGEELSEEFQKGKAGTNPANSYVSILPAAAIFFLGECTMALEMQT